MHVRILITNDDGIDAPGLSVLDEIAHEVAGPGGEVWTVAPGDERSGVGHCVSYVNPVRIEERGPRRFALHGTPADCVLAGLFHVLADGRPDLVLSGVNRGNNSGENAVYSGTVGATMEAALHGIKSVALSQFCGPRNLRSKSVFEAARSHATPLIRRLLELDIWQCSGDYGVFYNVNFPPEAASDVKGTRLVAQGFRGNGEFSVVPYRSPSRRNFLFIQGPPQDRPTRPGTDVHANVHGYISVTPMHADLTSGDAMKRLEGAFN